MKLVISEKNEKKEDSITEAWFLSRTWLFFFGYALEGSGAC